MFLFFTEVKLNNLHCKFLLSEKPETDDSIKGKYCIGLYDSKPYPGVTLDTDVDEVKVQVMHSTGKNRFFWPLLDDVLWYKQEHFLTLIDPPK